MQSLHKIIEFNRKLLLITLSSAFFAAAICSVSEAQTDRIVVPGCISPRVRLGRALGNVPPEMPMRVTLSLPLRNRDTLLALLEAIYEPGSEIEGRYLTPQQFTDQYGPTSEDYSALMTFARISGLQITGIHANRVLLNAAGNAGVIGSAFGVNIVKYVLPDGSTFYGPDREPTVPASMRGKLLSIIGLDNASTAQSSLKSDPLSGKRTRSHRTTKAAKKLPQQKQRSGGFAKPDNIGTGPGGGLTPAEIKSCYNLKNTYLHGGGETIGLVELDGFLKSDVTAYEDMFNLIHVPLDVVKIDGFSGTPGAGQSEVTLDIEMLAALASHAQKFIVYEAPNDGASLLDLYNRIANDNDAPIISTSWSYPENGTADGFFDSEDEIFLQFAAQGQTFVSSCGDFGAYDDKSVLIAADPAANPRVFGVGGTRLSPLGVDGSWAGETTWSDSSATSKSPFGIGGGGGISERYSIPKYQMGFVFPSSLGSTTMRNVPDAALNAASDTRYAAYYKGDWHAVYGTSCAAPLWAAFFALVNQQRVMNGLSRLGDPHKKVYTVASTSHYHQDFHDIADNSNNLYYPALPGYDLATGLGTFNGLNLLLNLANSQQLIRNAGFEAGNAPAPWSASQYVISQSGAEPAFQGSWLAWLGGYGTVHSDHIIQTVTIPASATSATLSFWMHITTAEKTVSTPYDTLQVRVWKPNGPLLATLKTFSNLDHSTAYKKVTFDMSQFIGQQISIELRSMEDASLQTSFFVDEFALDIK